MKLLVFLVFAAFVVAVQGVIGEEKEKMREIFNKCKAKSGVSQESVEKIRRGDPVNDPKLKEHGLCLAKETGLMNEAGELQIETIKTKLKKIGTDDSETDRLVKKCAITKETLAETAHYLITCLFREGKTTLNKLHEESQGIH